jgi:hypothetical protein
MKKTRHPSYQKIEQLVLDRLGSSDDPVVVRMEEHLLVCPRCVNRAEHALELAQLIREALSPEQAASAGGGVIYA